MVVADLSSHARKDSSNAQCNQCVPWRRMSRERNNGLDSPKSTMCRRPFGQFNHQDHYFTPDGMVMVNWLWTSGRRKISYRVYNRSSAI